MGAGNLVVAGLHPGEVGDAERADRVIVRGGEMREQILDGGAQLG